VTAPAEPGQTLPLLESLPHSVPQSCSVLLLGSMPGAASLAAQQYYAHPRNLFWPFMAQLFAVDADQPYALRLQQLNAAGVGVWDVLQACERPGSLDSDIRRASEVPNDVAGLLLARPGISVVGCNGAKAFQLFQRHVAPVLEAGRAANLTVLRLPSTSPANQSIPRDVKLSAWQALKAPPATP
jgi:hypoxanthine-DNA glycosylase